jgi:uncharacterized protein
MKYLILVGVIAVALWWLRMQRNTSNSSDNPKSTGQQPQNMVRCAHCDLHLPQSDAVKGSLGLYCSNAHLQAKEG